LRVTFGSISGIDRTFRGPRGLRITGSLEHTAPLLPGSSGGPVLDVQGQLLGINTNRLGEGFYLAIPADETLRRRVDALARGESARPPQLGITITPGHLARRMRRAVGLPDAEGLLIRDVAEDSPAARASPARRSPRPAHQAGGAEIPAALWFVLSATAAHRYRRDEPQIARHQSSQNGTTQHQLSQTPGSGSFLLPTATNWSGRAECAS